MKEIKLNEEQLNKFFNNIVFHLEEYVDEKQYYYKSKKEIGVKKILENQKDTTLSLIEVLLYDLSNKKIIIDNDNKLTIEE